MIAQCTNINLCDWTLLDADETAKNEIRFFFPEFDIEQWEANQAENKV
jgi:hypothetical protein